MINNINATIYILTYGKSKGRAENNPMQRYHGLCILSTLCYVLCILCIVYYIMYII